MIRQRIRKKRILIIPLEIEESVCEHVLEAFGLDPKSSHIVKGHFL